MKHGETWPAKSDRMTLKCDSLVERSQRNRSEKGLSNGREDGLTSRIRGMAELAPFTIPALTSHVEPAAFDLDTGVLAIIPVRSQ